LLVASFSLAAINATPAKVNVLTVQKIETGIVRDLRDLLSDTRRKQEHDARKTPGRLQ
jgi:hypothetical protein